MSNSLNPSVNPNSVLRIPEVFCFTLLRYPEEFLYKSYAGQYKD